MEKDLASLEQMIERLADRHERLGELVDAQRVAIRRADPAALADAGGRIESLVGEIARLETARRQLCQRLAPRLGLSTDQAARARLTTISERVGGRWGARLRRAADVLADRLDRVGRSGRVNQAVASRLSEFFGDLFGQIARLGRETGCYDARGRRTLTPDTVGVNMGGLSVIG